MGEEALPLSVELAPPLGGPQHFSTGIVVDTGELVPHCSPPHGPPQLMASGTDGGRKRHILPWDPDTRNLTMLQLIYRPHKMGFFFFILGFWGGMGERCRHGKTGR